MNYPPVIWTGAIVHLKNIRWSKCNQSAGDGHQAMCDTQYGLLVFNTS